MNEQHLKFVKEHSITVNEYSKNNFNFECLVFDTESCTNTYVDVKNSDAKEIEKHGARVYGWGLGCTRSDMMIYGQTLSEFIDLIPKLFEQWYNKNMKNIKIKGKKKPSSYYVKFPCAVHNLGWDIEFFKYVLPIHNFNYKMAQLKTARTKGSFYTTTQDVQQDYSYHIVQSKNTVYGASLYYPTQYERKNKDGSITKIGVCLDIFDSYKIISCSENEFHEYVEDVDEMFYKMSEEYDYDSFREIGHKQSDLELCYQYNDIYMLKETLQQFYIDGLCDGLMPTVGRRTASSIAFHKLKQITFGEENTEELYNNYFELNYTTRHESLRKRMEKVAYQGGFTHASHLYVGKHMKRKGCSIDINSSYPSQMAYKKFPYGKPWRGSPGKLPNLQENQVAIIEVGFDFVRPKTNKDELAIFKIGTSNIQKLNELVGNVSGQEYFMTNITKDGRILELNKPMKGSRLTSSYQVCLTNVELDFWLKHYDFGTFKLNEWGCIEEETCDFNGLEIGEVLIYKAEVGKFREFVEYFTEMKVENKKLGNKPKTNQAKLFLNSAYGKFGTKTDQEEKDLILNKHGLYEFTSINMIQYEGKEFYRPYACFVTAYGRLQLWNTIIDAVGVENFIYCDTDSIYCFREEKTLVEDMNKVGQTVDKTQLGKWDIETHFDEFKVLGQKKYMYNNTDIDKKSGEQIGRKLKCCGLPKKAQKIVAKQGFDEFYLGKKVDGKLQRKKVLGGCLLLDAKFEIKKIMW